MAETTTKEKPSAKKVENPLANGNMVSRTKALAIYEEAKKEMARRYYVDYVEYVHEKRWIRAKHLVFICKTIQDFIEDKISEQILILQVSPQHGKSMSVTETLPSWYLGKFPTRRVIEVSYGDDLAQGFGRRNKEKIERFGKKLFGIELSKKVSAATEFELNNNVGGMISRGIMAGITGKPGDLILIDDPVKNRLEADLQSYRDRVWDEWLNSIKTRLSAKGKIIIIMCLTGDTSILMADGTEKALRNIHIGDNVATYQNGELTVSVVQNWKCQGSDLVFTMRMESGVVIRGNERHPFLVERDGYTEWVRIKNLKAGDKILKARRTGGNGEEFCAQKKTAISPQSARGIATPTTINSSGRVGTDPRRLTRNPDERRDLSIGTESVLPNTKFCLLRKTESAPCVENCLAQTYEHIGAENSASIMIMSQEECEDSCATTAILQSGMEKQKKNYSLPLNMFEIVRDSIVDIVESGYEDVFDIQVESTENFIANGLVSHNTRWHEDDLAGRVIKDDEGKNDVRVINLPCEAEENDPLGREIGDALFPEIGKDKAWMKKFKQSYETAEGTRAWTALFQGRPSSQEGNMLKRHWWRYWKPKGLILPPVTVKLPNGESQNIDAVDLPDDMETTLQSWDMTFKDTAGTDFVAGGVWGNKGSSIFYLDQVYERMDFVNTIKSLTSTTEKWPQATMKLIEDKANGPAVISMLKMTINGLIAIQPKGSKQARASAVSPLMEAGNVFLPHPMVHTWTNLFVEQCAAFPNGKNDDLVDQCSQALQRFIHTIVPEEEKVDNREYPEEHFDDDYEGMESFFD